MILSQIGGLNGRNKTLTANRKFEDKEIPNGQNQFWADAKREAFFFSSKYRVTVLQSNRFAGNFNNV
jgi:hypothetical protein